MTHLIGQARLCGHVGQRVGGPAGEDVLVRDLEKWKSRPLVESAPNLRIPDLQDAQAEGVVIPVPALERAVDEELQHAGCVHPRGLSGFCGLLPRRHGASSAGAFLRRLACAMNSNGSIEKSASPDYARDLNPSEIWVQKKSRSSLI